MRITKYFFALSLAICSVIAFSNRAQADTLSLTAGSNATTTPNVATAITGFQIVGPASQTTPVKIRATSGTLNLSAVSGVTMSGNGSGTVTLSGTVEKLNTALSTLTYTRNSTGTDTLEVSLVESGEVFFTDNGHLYKFISGSYNWTSASTSAGTQTAYGATGYLATITSSAENAFIKDRLSGDGWIGASDSAVEGDWRWMTGPEAGTLFWRGTGGGSAQGGNYANWAGSEPNQSGEEDCAETYVSNGTWNDFPCNASLGYVVEFGRPGSLPTVVAQNISIVTADVPTITSFSPANAATSISPSANLVIGFSKNVTPQTGNILIKKVSDDSTVESIDVAGGLISGSGTNSITINPSATLDEGVQYYIVVPPTAFKDSSNNYFAGFSASSTWAFATSDVTAPVITALASAAATTTATISWTTNERASTRLWYSPDSSFASSTNETDTGTRVTSHQVSLSNLVACTLYSYKAVSKDAFANVATSTANAFLTSGCSGGAAPESSTSTPVTVNAAATSTLQDNGRTLTIETPAHFTATSSSVVIQIKSLDSEPVLGAIGMPSSSLTSAASIVFNVTALIDSSTVLESFDIPVTVSYHYTDEDIAGLQESSLSMYHYDGTAWAALDNCSINADSNTITCTAPHFSVFAIFGMPIPEEPSQGRGSTSTTVQARVKNLTQSGNTAAAEALKAEWPQLFPRTFQASATSSAPAAPVRDLKLFMTGEDVLLLQKFLNANGYELADSGPGSPGNETLLFGSLTRTALSKFQAAHAVQPSVGYFGPLTRAKIKELGLKGVWW